MTIRIKIVIFCLVIFFCKTSSPLFGETIPSIKSVSVRSPELITFYEIAVQSYHNAKLLFSKIGYMSENKSTNPDIIAKFNQEYSRFNDCFNQLLNLKIQNQSLSEDYYLTLDRFKRELETITINEIMDHRAKADPMSHLYELFKIEESRLIELLHLFHQHITNSHLLIPELIKEDVLDVPNLLKKYLLTSDSFFDKIQSIRHNTAFIDKIHRYNKSNPNGTDISYVLQSNLLTIILRETYNLSENEILTFPSLSDLNSFIISKHPCLSTDQYEHLQYYYGIYQMKVLLQQLYSASPQEERSKLLRIYLRNHKNQSMNLIYLKDANQSYDQLNKPLRFLSTYLRLLLKPNDASYFDSSTTKIASEKAIVILREMIQTHFLVSENEDSFDSLLEYLGELDSLTNPFYKSKKFHQSLEILVFKTFAFSYLSLLRFDTEKTKITPLDLTEFVNRQAGRAVLSPWDISTKEMELYLILTSNTPNLTIREITEKYQQLKTNYSLIENSPDKDKALDAFNKTVGSFKENLSSESLAIISTNYFQRRFEESVHKWEFKIGTITKADLEFSAIEIIESLKKLIKETANLSQPDLAELFLSVGKNAELLAKNNPQDIFSITYFLGHHLSKKDFNYKLNIYGGATLFLGIIGRMTSYALGLYMSARLVPILLSASYATEFTSFTLLTMHQLSELFEYHQDATYSSLIEASTPFLIHTLIKKDEVVDFQSQYFYSKLGNIVGVTFFGFMLKAHRISLNEIKTLWKAFEIPEFRQLYYQIGREFRLGGKPSAEAIVKALQEGKTVDDIPTLHITYQKLYEVISKQTESSIHANPGRLKALVSFFKRMIPFASKSSDQKFLNEFLYLFKNRELAKYIESITELTLETGEIKTKILVQRDFFAISKRALSSFPQYEDFIQNFMLVP